LKEKEKEKEMKKQTLFFFLGLERHLQAKGEVKVYVVRSIRGWR
jgi:hypothetical protein